MQDLRDALRLLGRSPGFSLVAVLTLALGIGATSSVLGVVRAVLLRPLPFPQAERLALLAGVHEENAAEDWPLSFLELRDWRERTRSFASMAFWSAAHSFTLRGGAEPELVQGEMVSSEYFDTLGISPALGRGFLPGEDRPGVEPVAVLGHGLWTRRFGADPGVLGRKIDLGDLPFTVVGVLPPGFRGLGDRAEVWVPLSTQEMEQPGVLESRRARWLLAVGRLRPGVTPAAARRDLQAVAARLAAEQPDTNRGITARAVPLAQAWFSRLEPALWTLLGAASFVLLIACGNLALLLLVRATARQREIAVRLALGGSRGRIVRQLLSESLLLALLGGGLGLVLALVATPLLVTVSGLQLRSFVRVGVDGAVTAAGLGLALACGLLFGLAPAILASRAPLAAILKEGSRTGTAGGGWSRFQRGLVVAEVALALILTAGSGLLLRGFLDLARADLGFRPENLLTLRIGTQGERYAEDAPFQILAAELTGRLGALPGVESVAAVGPTIPTDEPYGGRVTLEERLLQGGREPTVVVLRHHISPSYFRTLGTPLLAGRECTAADTGRTGGALVISRTGAETFWPGQSPLGQRVRLGYPDTPAPWFTIVGVAGDIRHEGHAEGGRLAPDLYICLAQEASRNPQLLNLLVRTSIPPESVAGAVRAEIRRIAPDLPVFDVETQERRLSRQRAGGRFLAGLAGGFAGLALGLAALGLYGVVGWTVGRRRRETGIRLVLGARPAGVAGATLAIGVRLALMGMAAGWIGAFALERTLAARLPGLPPPDLRSLATASLILLATTCAASLLPALRAARTDPAVTLREE